MPSPILHLGATVLCEHGGLAQPIAPSRRVSVSGQPIATIAEPYSVAGCGFLPPLGNGPCVSAHWLTGSARVTSEGQPLALMSGTAVCSPTGTPLLPTTSQTRALAT